MQVNYFFYMNIIIADTKMSIIVTVQNHFQTITNHQ